MLIIWLTPCMRQLKKDCLVIANDSCNQTKYSSEALIHYAD